MSLRFILGDGRCDHEQAILDAANAWLEKPQTEVFFLSLTTISLNEKEILQALKQGTGDFASVRAQVYSFHRLAWFYLQQTGWLSKTAITDTGATMILRKILLDLEEELILFEEKSINLGLFNNCCLFIKKCRQVISQPKICISVER